MYSYPVCIPYVLILFFISPTIDPGIHRSLLLADASQNFSAQVPRPQHTYKCIKLPVTPLSYPNALYRREEKYGCAI